MIGIRCRGAVDVGRAETEECINVAWSDAATGHNRWAVATGDEGSQQFAALGSRSLLPGCQHAVEAEAGEHSVCVDRFPYLVKCPMERQVDVRTN